MEFIKTITIKDSYIPVQSFIYVLWDKIKDVPFYIGKTTDPSNRFSNHLRPMKNKDTLKSLRVKQILDIDPNGIEMRIIEKTNSLEDSEREQYWIRELNKTYKLVNFKHEPTNYYKDTPKKDEWTKIWNPVRNKYEFKKRITEKIY